MQLRPGGTDLRSKPVVARSAGPSRDPHPTVWRLVSLLFLLVAVNVTVAHRVSSVAENDPRIYVEAATSVSEGRYDSASEPSGRPRYPPGFPIMLAPFVAGWGDDGAIAVSTAIAVGLVGLVWATARRLGGHRAAAAAAAVWAASPLVSDYSAGVMSDASGAAFVLLALLAAMAGRWVLVGLALGWGGWIRLVHPVFLGGVGRRRAAWLAALAVLVPLALFQLRTYGRLAGYDGDGAQFSLSFITGGAVPGRAPVDPPWPNWQFFPGLLIGLRGGMVPLLPLFAGFELWARRAEPAARLAAWIVVANVVVYLPYYFQASRFLFPAASVLIVFAAAGAVRLVDDLRATDSAPDRALASSH